MSPASLSPSTAITAHNTQRTHGAHSLSRYNVPATSKLETGTTAEPLLQYLKRIHGRSGGRPQGKQM